MHQRFLLGAFLSSLSFNLFADTVVQLRVWQKHEITLKAERTHANPYADVDVWIQLEGPRFSKTVYGFWDGGNTFRVRIALPSPGEWRWTSFSNPPDPGLAGKSGRLAATPWTEQEKQDNPVRRGFLRPTSNGHALEYADGTPFFLIGDTWWPAGTFRFPMAGRPGRPVASAESSFEDYVAFRKEQGFNSIAILAAFPHWANDGHPAALFRDGPPRIPIRAAWPDPKTRSARDMHNSGGRPFLFPGKVPGFENIVPDFDRINPAYFAELDRKIDCLNEQGFIPFVEAARRDVAIVWKQFYRWPQSYARYLQYLSARLQANSVIFSPIHYDWPASTIPAHEFNLPIQYWLTLYGRPPFGTPLSPNSSPSSHLNFGLEPGGSWVDIHQSGNDREHMYYRHHTEIFFSSPLKPSLNGEPYYPGFQYEPGVENTWTAPPGSERDDRYTRSAMYGNFLCGALAGAIYGADGIWQGAREPEAPIRMWEAFHHKSAAQMRHFSAFVHSQGSRYQHLIPSSDSLAPNSSALTRGYDGWAFAARSPERDWYLVYFEKDAPRAAILNAPRLRRWRARWFDPRTGAWADAGVLETDPNHKILLPAPPTSEDWALSLEWEPVDPAKPPEGR